MDGGIIIFMGLGLISGFGLLSILISFFEKDFEEEYFQEIRSNRNIKRKQPAKVIPIDDELDITTYDFYTDEL
jgi:hypothetical protein